MATCLRKSEEFAVAVPLVAGVRGDLSGGDLQRGEQGGGAVSLVIVGAEFGVVEPHR